MVYGFWGKKIGMTQLFVGNKAVSVTAVDFSGWIITQIKNVDRDGYEAIQVGLPRKRYIEQTFSDLWLKKLKTYFQFIKEIRVVGISAGLEVGKSFDVNSLMKSGDFVGVTGITKGAGFAGVVRRHSFAGAKASHGCDMGNRPGSNGFIRTSGKVIKGKKLPGHMGQDQRTILNLEIVKNEPELGCVFIKGSVPGKSGTIVFVHKRD